ncbi:hypothetical protein AQS8620_02255 [Aquimixticola soesokkakensis]|uniref:Uncharacterized protein n=1 Tax=Aquimixticola soesokkakensis TaxID=1519096 RepID=A0A1Y5T461_9RHOB|nr:hypothetical protein [Aquimixticola soesokkakensis]SLN51962.1 hypothetical protein AQS8620_02255 [Aquimixticola soesokkakensis]
METLTQALLAFDTKMMSLSPEQNMQIFALGLGLIALSVALLLFQKMRAGKAPHSAVKAVKEKPCNIPGVALPKRAQPSSRGFLARRSDEDDPFVRRVSEMRKLAA